MDHGYTQILNKMRLSHGQFQIESEPYSSLHSLFLVCRVLWHRSSKSNCMEKMQLFMLPYICVCDSSTAIYIAYLWNCFRYCLHDVIRYQHNLMAKYSAGQKFRTFNVMNLVWPPLGRGLTLKNRSVTELHYKVSDTSKVYLSPPRSLEKIPFKCAKLLTTTVNVIDSDRNWCFLL